ncbi:CLUMA_CG002206, isoform A [Clunio marinus]|uniref:Mitochondrial GTPase 1 n=1 Tax=Clunio marinus TaxID=568069 RepID=A0A1J1HLN1_9DIPT|nr:CLUMA_CG002206, isoform A [Clunio marinus]
MSIQNFRKHFELASKEAIRWFPGHMGKGMKIMQQKLKTVDLLIEVHDARIPFSGRNINFHDTLTAAKPTIMVLSKKDLIEKEYHRRIVEKIQNDPQFPIENVFLANAKDPSCDGLKKIIPRAIKMIQNSNRFNRAEEKERNIMIIGVPNVGKSSLINVLRNRHLNKKGASAVGAVAGITRSVLTQIKICEDPLIKILDTPGVLMPNIKNVEMGMKLALCSCFQDHLVGEDVIADYLLYWLNKHKRFHYVDIMGLDQPTDDITHVLFAGAQKLGATLRMHSIASGTMEVRPNLRSAAKYFVNSFRKGQLGKLCLDELD